MWLFLKKYFPFGLLAFGLGLRLNLITEFWLGYEPTEVDQLNYFSSMAQRGAWHWISESSPSWEVLSTAPFYLFDQLGFNPRLSGFVFF